MNIRSLQKNFIILLCAACAAGSVRAAVYQKANNANLLNDPNSWVQLGVPGSGDTAQWDSTVAAANSVGLGAAASWNGIVLNSPGGLVTITNDNNVLTLGSGGIDLSVTNNGLTLNCPLHISANQIWTVTNSRTLTINGPVSETTGGLSVTKNGNGGLTLAGTNNFSGAITLNAGTLTLASSNAWPGAAALNFKGGTLAINAGVVVTNLSIVTSNLTAAANVSCSGIIANNLTINPGTNNIPPTASGIYAVPASGFVQVNLSGAVSPGGFITNYGVLNLTGGGVQNIGTIIGAGSEAAGTLGGIQDNNTNAAGKTLTFGNGSAFSYFKPGVNSKSTLQVAGNGSVYFKWFGYNNAGNYTNTLNGGTWTIGQMGQNNSGAQFVGLLNITGGAAVTVTNLNGGSGPGPAFSHGTYNIINGSMTFNAAVAEGFAANNFGLNIYANNNGGGPGVFTVTNGGLTLGFSASTLNTASENNSLNVGTGGSVNITGNLTAGTTQAQSNPETNSINLSGGKLVINGTLQAQTTIATGQDRVFTWTGGQLSAATITTNAGFNDAASALNSTALTNNAGVLAPGDDGIPGRTIVNGNYVQTNGGTIIMDIGGTTRASSFQASTNGNYDYLQVAGQIQVGGSLKVKLVGGFTPAYTDQLNIIATTGAGNFITGAFTNLVAGPALGRVLVEGTTNSYFTAVLNSQTNTIYLINYTNITSSSIASYSTNITASVVNGGTALNVTWPATHLGWTLQAQTNSLGAGLGTNWADVPGTANVTSTNLTIVPANPAVFYRLRQ
jgi:fibronectin-binding autotransporter adhesin